MEKIGQMDINEQTAKDIIIEKDQEKEKLGRKDILRMLIEEMQRIEKKMDKYSKKIDN